MTNATRDVRRSRTIASAIAVGLLGAALVSGTALAGKPTGGGGGGGHKGGGGSTAGTGTIALATPLVVDRNGNGTANWNDVVRFDVSTTSTTKPWVHLKCNQGGSMVAQGYEGYFVGSLDDGNFGLSAPMWTGGAADCTAYLENPSGSVLGTTTFHVDA